MIVVAATIAIAGCAPTVTEDALDPGVTKGSLDPGVTEGSPDASEGPDSCPGVADYDEQGVASWYGKSHHGRRTASGDTFDMNKLTASHRSLPFGTEVTVTNLANGRSATLIVNDRGPYGRGRLLDVSRRAARDLGFLDAGVARVRVTAVAPCSDAAGRHAARLPAEHPFRPVFA
jgi:rare lipoprotein A